MSFDASIPQSRRITVVTAVIAAHIVLLVALFIMRSAAPVVAKAKPGSLSVIALGTPASVPDAVPADRPLIVLVKQLRLQIAAEAKSGAQSSVQSVAVGGCASLDQITTAIINDPEAVSSILNSPPETRSIADAIVVWNAAWIAAAAGPDVPLSPVRTVIQQSLGELSGECLDEEVVGPRLIPIAAGEGTMFVVIGSGSWRWRDLTTEAQGPSEALPVVGELPDRR